LFVDEIVGGSIPRQFIPAVDRGIQEAAVRGIIAGFPLVDFKVEVFDGSYHTVDSNEMSFKMAGIQAFKAVAAKCKPVLLEPLDELEITTPDDYMGDVLGDLSSRRGHILGTEPGDSGTVIRAIVPQAELHSYASSIQSMTQGRAFFKRHFKGYEEAPTEVASKVIEEHAKERDEELAGAH
jgi:elongation factor G